MEKKRKIKIMESTILKVMAYQAIPTKKRIDEK